MNLTVWLLPTAHWLYFSVNAQTEVEERGGGGNDNNNQRDVWRMEASFPAHVVDLRFFILLVQWICVCVCIYAFLFLQKLS